MQLLQLVHTNNIYVSLEEKTALLQSGWQLGVLKHALLIGFRDCVC